MPPAGTEQDIKARKGKARQTFLALRPIWNKRNILQETKLRLFDSNIKSVVLYGAETWRTKGLHNKLQVFGSNCMGRILSIRWPDKITNLELWRKTGQTSITKCILWRKWRSLDIQLHHLGMF